MARRSKRHALAVALLTDTRTQRAARIRQARRSKRHALAVALLFS